MAAVVVVVFKLTLLGDTLQAEEHVNATLSANPSCAVMLMVALAWAPILIAGKWAAWLNRKSGFNVTVSARFCDFAAGAPSTLATIETVLAPTAADAGTAIVTFASSGADDPGSTVADGLNVQVAPAGRPVQLKFTGKLNDPRPLT